jgi:ABC-type lipoprotein release transport system permease subunit
MRVLSLIWKELVHRRLNFALGALGVTVTVALLVAFLTTAAASQRETIRLTRDMGFNLRIIPRDTDMDRFWALGYSDRTMGDDAAERLARCPGVFRYYNHLVAMLQRRHPVEGGEVVLTGVAAALTAPEQRQRPMGYKIKPGTVIVGQEAARRLGLKPGGTLALGGRSFVVERCLLETGTDEDVRVYGALRDVQQVLGLPGRINEIKAIDCLCLTSDQDPLSILRAELAQGLPEAQVLQMRTLADARARQRQTAEKYFAFLGPLLLAIGAVWVGLLAALNVRERRLEIGILRSLGQGAGPIAALFLGRAMAAGLAGACLGWAAGTVLALRHGLAIFPVTAASLAPEWPLLLWALLAAPALAALAALLPTAQAVALDPADILREG